MGTDETITGLVHDRKLTLNLYVGDKLTKTSSIEIPGDVESPKLAVEHILTDLMNVKFQHIREVECDHTHPEIEKLLATAPQPGADPLL